MALSNRRLRTSRYSPQAGAEKSHGFTLIELMVVLFIIAISSAVIIPRIGAGWKRMEDREFLQEFIQTLKRGRIQAMNSGQIVTFRIRDSERLYDIEDPPQMVIPPNVDIFADHLDSDPDTQDHVILFYPDGSISGSDLEIDFDQQRAFHISIQPLFGTVQWREVEHR